MKHRKNIMAWGRMLSLTTMAVATALLASCSSDAEEELSAGKMAVPLHIASSGVSSFDSGKIVNLYVLVNNGNGATDGSQYDTWLREPMEYTASGTWESTTPRPICWKDQTTEHLFLAIFPVTNRVEPSAHSSFTFVKDGDNDLVVGRSIGKCETSSSVDLEMEHLMARLDVNVTLGSELALGMPEVSSVSIVTYASPQVTIDFFAQEGITLAPDGDAVERELEYCGDDDGVIWRFSTAMAPERLTSLTIKVVYADQSTKVFTYQPSSGILLQRNHISTYNLKLDKDEVIEEEGSCSVSEWVIDDARSYPTPDYEYEPGPNRMKVYTAKGLLAWAEKVNSDNMTKLTLMDNIRMPDDTPMPTIDVISCVIDGQGHTISNLRFTTNSYRSFCRYNQGTIKNLIFDFAEENDHPSNYACFYGIADINSGTIENCKVKGFAKKFRVSNAICEMNVSGGSVIGCESHLSIQAPDINGSEYHGMVGLNLGEIIACLDASIPSTTYASAVCFQNGDFEYSSDISIAGFIYYCMDKVDFSNSNKQSIYNKSGDVEVTTYDAGDAQNQVNALNSNLEYLYINNSWSYTRYRFKYNSSNTENPVSVAP